LRPFPLPAFILECLDFTVKNKKPTEQNYPVYKKGIGKITYAKQLYEMRRKTYYALKPI